MAQSTVTPSVQVTGRVANKKTKFIIGGVIIALAIVFLIYTGVQSTAAYFYTIDELYAKGVGVENQTVRVSGKVDAATIEFNNRDLLLTFDVTSETGQHMQVIFNGPKPDQMREGAEAIVEGKYDGQAFTAQNLLLKCPSRYEENGIEEVQVEAVR
jgi:cytochrome c-type biogenesis protein CcmE